MSLVLHSLPVVTLTAQTLKIAPHEEARVLSIVFAGLLRLDNGNASGDNVVHNSRQSGAASGTHRLRTDNQLPEPLPTR